MFFVVFLFIFIGYPVAFSLGGPALVFAVVGVELGFFEWGLLYALPERIFGVMNNFILLAVPFFIFMGTMLEKSKLAEDLLKTIGRVFGPLRGGLALAVVFVGALLAAATGVVGASVVAMGLISLPVMMRYNYSPRLATGIITASGTLGQVIPPSVVLIVLADQMGISVGDLFVGSLLPGLMLAGMFALYVVGVAIFNPEAAPALPIEERQGSMADLAKQVVLVLLPPLFLESRGRWVLVREERNNNQGSMIYPFTVNGEPFVPAAKPVLGSRDEAKVCLVGYNLGGGDLQLDARILDVGGETIPGGAFDLVERTVTGISGLDKLLVSFRPEGLEDGDYMLQFAVTDPDAGLVRSSSIPITVFN